MPPLPQPGMNSYDAQNGMGQQQQQQQQPYGSQQFGQPSNQGYAQQPPAPYQQQPVMNQPPMPQQPMGMGQPQQQFRPQQPIQPVAKPKIDPDQIPSPVAVQENDQAQWDDTPFITSSKTLVTPLASSDFMAIDEGMRMNDLMCSRSVFYRSRQDCNHQINGLPVDLYRKLQPSLFQDDNLQCSQHRGSPEHCSAAHGSYHSAIGQAPRR